MANKVNLLFNHQQGQLQTESNYIVDIFDEKANPYDLLLGALGSCFYATFISIAEKKKLNFGEVRLNITGKKRTEIPTTLEHVVMDMFIINPSNKEQLIKSAQLGAKYCSIHETISKVAQIDLNINFE